MQRRTWAWAVLASAAQPSSKASESVRMTGCRELSFGMTNPLMAVNACKL